MPGDQEWSEHFLAALIEILDQHELGAYFLDFEKNETHLLIYSNKMTINYIT